MSGFVSEPTRFDESKLAAAKHEEKLGFDGQRHDIIGVRENGNISDTGGSAINMDSGTEISAGQKMLSAVFGSVLTSLLGTILP